MRVAVAVSLAATGLVSPGVGDEARARNKTPVRTAPGRVLVVSANLYETDYGDVYDSSDLRVFVRRMFRQVPRSPDVVLLQELWGRSASAVAGIMSRRSPDRYAVAMPAADPPWRQPSSSYVVGTDSAIVVNTRTMRIKRSGHLRLGYDPSKATGEVRVKRHPYALMKERRGNFALPVVSVHFPKAEHFTTRKVSRNVKARWMRTLTRRLGRIFPNEFHRKRRVIAGDFNNPRCQRNAPLCKFTSAYRVATRKLGYRDSVNIMNGWDNPIDFIFSKAPVSQSGVDHASKKQKRRYSDHRFRWALLEKKDRTAPTAPGRVGSGKGTHDEVKLRGWKPVRDGGSGFARFKVQRSRKGAGRGFHSIGRSRDTRFTDKRVKPGRKYWYRVVAFDRVGNRSGRTPAFRIRAGEPLPSSRGPDPTNDKSPLPDLDVPPLPHVDKPTADGPDLPTAPRPDKEPPNPDPPEPAIEPPLRIGWPTWR